MPAERGHGMDHEHYGWDPLPRRSALVWPNGATVAVVPLVLLEVHEDPVPDWPQYTSVGGGLVRASPNISRVSTREYGHRVGIFRMIEALRACSIRPTVAIDALSAELYPFLVRWLSDAGSEFIAHGISVNRPLHGAMTEVEERHYISETLDRLAAAGVETTGWLGPEYGESMRTPQILDELGISYVCDWCNDEQPYQMSTANGLVALPLLADLDDQTTLIGRMADLQAYGRHLERCVVALARDGSQAGRVMAFAVRPWVMGQPFRIGVFEKFLAVGVATPGVWFARSGEVVTEWRETRTLQPAAERGR